MSEDTNTYFFTKDTGKPLWFMKAITRIYRNYIPDNLKSKSNYTLRQMQQHLLFAINMANQD